MPWYYSKNLLILQGFLKKKDDKLEEFSGCFLSFFGNGALILSWQRFSLIKTAVLYIMLA